MTLYRILGRSRPSRYARTSGEESKVVDFDCDVAGGGGGKEATHCSHRSYNGINPHEGRQVLCSCSFNEINRKMSNPENVICA